MQYFKQNISLNQSGIGMVLLGLSSNSSDQSPLSKTHLNETKLNQTEQFIIEDEKPSFFNYLPLCAIILGAIGYHIGISPITWSYMGEYEC